MHKDRDIRQRIVGFVSFSFLTHCGLIALAFLAPNMIKDMGASSKQSETYLVDSTAQASAPAAALGETAQAEPQVVERAPEPVAAQSQPEEVKQPVEVKQAEKKSPVKKVLKSAKENAQAATKKVLALPTKKTAAAKAKAAHKVETIDQSEIAAKTSSNNSEDEAKPEVAADIKVEADKQQDETPQPLAEAEATAEKADAEAVQSSTTTEEAQPATEQKEEKAKEEPQDAGPVAAAVSKRALPSKTSAPAIAPIQKRAQSVNPSEQLGGLTNSAATQAAPVQAAPMGSSTGNANAASGAGAGGAGVAAGGIRDADSLMEQAGNVKPSYPIDDQRAGRQGTVVFDAMVTRDGSVQGIQLKQSSGFSTLDSSAYEAFKKHRYLPGQEGMVRKKFQFVLNGEKTEQARLRRR